MAQSQSTPAGRAPRVPYLAPAIAAVIGVSAGLLIGGPAVAFAGRAWQDFILPAFMEFQLSGIPLCGF